MDKIRTYSLVNDTAVGENGIVKGKVISVCNGKILLKKDYPVSLIFEFSADAHGDECGDGRISLLGDRSSKIAGS